MDTSSATCRDRSEFSVGTRVEVRTRYELGRWAPGFTIAGITADGYHVRRISDGLVLKESLTPDGVRLASTGPRLLQAIPRSHSRPPGSAADQVRPPGSLRTNDNDGFTHTMGRWRRDGSRPVCDSAVFRNESSVSRCLRPRFVSQHVDI